MEERQDRGGKMEIKKEKVTLVVDEIYDRLRSNADKTDVIEDRLESLLRRIKEKFIGEEITEHEDRDKQAMDCSLMQVAVYNTSGLERAFLLVQKIEEFI